MMKKSKKKIFNIQYKICLWKSYFEKGYGLTAYLKYIIILGGMLEGLKFESLKWTIIAGLGYPVLCFFIGMVWYKTNMIRAEAEVGNRYNYFQQEVRKELLNNGK